MPHIVINNLTKTIKSRPVLDNVNLTFQGGQIYGLVGPNGSGKTMLLRAICGLIFPDRGTVTVDGLTLRRDIPYPPSCGAVIENTQLLPGFTAFENLELLSRIKGTADAAMIRAALQALGLDPDSKAKVRTFSLGQKQRLALAQALFEDPEILLLDEPTNALDESGAARLRDILHMERDRGRLIILASHSPEDIGALCDAVVRVEQGRLGV